MGGFSEHDWQASSKVKVLASPNLGDDGPSSGRCHLDMLRETVLVVVFVVVFFLVF